MSGGVRAGPLHWGLATRLYGKSFWGKVWDLHDAQLSCYRFQVPTINDFDAELEFV